MEKNDKYLESKRIYNSKLSTFQIDRKLHTKVKEYCKENNIKVKDFLESIIIDKIK
jgi:hypothetical protein